MAGASDVELDRRMRLNQCIRVFCQTKNVVFVSIGLPDHALAPTTRRQGPPGFMHSRSFFRPDTHPGAAFATVSTRAVWLCRRLDTPGGRDNRLFNLNIEEGKDVHDVVLRLVNYVNCDPSPGRHVRCVSRPVCPPVAEFRYAPIYRDIRVDLRCYELVCSSEIDEFEMTEILLHMLIRIRVVVLEPVAPNSKELTPPGDKMCYTDQTVCISYVVLKSNDGQPFNTQRLAHLFTNAHGIMPDIFGRWIHIVVPDVAAEHMAAWQRHQARLIVDLLAFDQADCFALTRHALLPFWVNLEKARERIDTMIKGNSQQQQSWPKEKEQEQQQQQPQPKKKTKKPKKKHKEATADADVDVDMDTGVDVDADVKDN